MCLRRPFADRSGQTGLGDPARIMVTAEHIIDPGHPMRRFRPRLVREQGQALLEERLGFGSGAGLDIGLKRQAQRIGGGLASDGSRAMAPGGASQRHDAPLAGDRRRLGRPARHRQALQLPGLGKLGRLGEQGGNLCELDGR